MSDTGFARMKIVHEDGKVKQVFLDGPQYFVTYEPNNAIEVARAMTDAAFEADTRIKPVGDTLKAELIERHRMTLTARLALVMNSKRGDKLVSNGKLAQELTEIMLKEVF